MPGHAAAGDVGHPEAGDVGQAPAVPAVPAAAAPPTPARDYALSSGTARLGRLAGLRKIGKFSSAVSTVGLALMRRKGKAPQGAMLLAAAAGLAYITRSDK